MIKHDKCKDAPIGRRFTDGNIIKAWKDVKRLSEGDILATQSRVNAEALQSIINEYRSRDEAPNPDDLGDDDLDEYAELIQLN